MKKFFFLLYIGLLGLLVLSGCGNNAGNSANYQASKSQHEISNNEQRNNSEMTNENAPTETELSNFSTPLKSGSPNRITNIKLTCNKINEYVLRNGETFSFNKIVGPCTAEEGYLKSEIYVNKKITYALGGGNCQVSTTLYNCCLPVNGIKIVERHEHGMPVDYIEDGKDAAVSYGSKDLSFKNETGTDLKIYVSIDEKKVSARICKLE